MMGGFSTVGGIGFCYAITSDVLFANDAEKGVSETTYTKKKEIQITSLKPSPTGLSIYFEMLITNSDYAVYGRIYRNGSPYGTERSTTSTSYVVFTEVLPFYPNDYVQLYSRISASVPYYGSVRNFRVCGKIVQAPSSASEVFGAVNTLT